ncbi:putative Glycosyltransferase subfamily 4-like domain-containing protein [Helianthus annuus]|nr:putative Glycosyltransferase subfamily 4-like domain-containing protein [Helianthus annuus]
MVVTTHEGVLEEFHGAKLVGSRSFSFPWYQQVPLSLALSPRIINEVKQFKPDIIHASSPGIMVRFWSAYDCKNAVGPHRDVLSYTCACVNTYQDTRIADWSSQCEFLHQAADLTLVPSAAIAKDLQQYKVAASNTIRLWNKDVDSDSFHPKFHSHEMRIRLSNGEPDRPLIVHVGRIGVKKNLDLLKRYCVG